MQDKPKFNVGDKVLFTYSPIYPHINKMQSVSGLNGVVRETIPSSPSYIYRIVFQNKAVFHCHESSLTSTITVTQIRKRR
jgi:hypothetical protein